MKRKYRVLWIEDGALWDIPHLTAPIFMDGRIDLILEENPSDGIRQLCNDKFDAIVVDIRLSPGEDQDWIELFKKAGANKTSARLGIQLLYTISGHNEAKVKREKCTAGIKINQIGVLTVERYQDIKKDLEKIGIKRENYCRKVVDLPETALLDLIEKIIK